MAILLSKYSKGGKILTQVLSSSGADYKYTQTEEFILSAESLEKLRTDQQNVKDAAAAYSSTTTIATVDTELSKIQTIKPKVII